ncbi:MAG: hypothetical protein F6K65_26420 [Moorea sp. SIO3C2]|nr:hypothetical protein [Moorena sp. SIO3C2]
MYIYILFFNMSLTREQYIQGFIELIKQQYSLFLPDTRIDLAQEIDNFPTDTDVASLSDTIYYWCERHPDISQALRDKLNSKFGSTRIGIQKGPAESIPEPEPKDYITDLKNQMRESFKPPQEPKPSDSSK